MQCPCISLRKICVMIEKVRSTWICGGIFTVSLIRCAVYSVQLFRVLLCTSCRVNPEVEDFWFAYYLIIKYYTMPKCVPSITV